MLECTSGLEKLAKFFRFGLLAAIVAVTTLIIAGPEHHGILNPFRVAKVNAEGGIFAAPGYIALTTFSGNNDRFYIIDTSKKPPVICAYTVDGAKLRLVSAREFDADSDIIDGSMTLTLPNGLSQKGIEGGNGVDVNTAKAYGEAQNKLLEKEKIQW